MPEAIDHAGLRELARGACGFDPGALADGVLLGDVGLSGLGRLLFVNELELTYGIELPVDLIDVLETVGDVRHFVQVKVEQQAGPWGSVGDGDDGGSDR